MKQNGVQIFQRPFILFSFSPLLAFLNKMDWQNRRGHFFFFQLLLAFPSYVTKVEFSTTEADGRKVSKEMRFKNHEPVRKQPCFLIPMETKICWEMQT